jgi:phosphate transport system substrate-binding protein
MIRSKIMRLAATAALVAITATVSTPAMAMAGTVRLSGSTTVQPLAQAWANAYHATHSGTSVTVAGGGSGAGFTDASKGVVNFGMSSRVKAASDENKNGAGAVIMTPVARDAMAIIVNPNNNVRSLTAAQVKGIYTGQYKTWKQVGGKTSKKFNAKKAIVLAGRTGSSGTYEYFKADVLGGTRQSKRTKGYASNGMVRSKVASDKYAIGYVGMAFINSKVRAVRIDTVSPTKANALAGRYRWVRDLYFVNYAKYPVNAEAQSFLNFCLSPTGQAIAGKTFLPLN